MTKYEMIVEALQEKVNNGELTLEDANKLNDMAFEKYCGNEFTEASDDNKDLELIDQLRELVEAGKVTLDKDSTKCIKNLIKGAEEGEDTSADNDSDNKEDETPEDTSEKTPAE